MTITDHAYERAKERLSLNKAALERLAVKALEQGKKHSDTKGQLKKYIDGLWFRHRNANNVRLYGENLFLFVDNTLVTVYQLPNNLRKHMKY